MNGLTLTDRQVRAIRTMVNIDTNGQDWRWAVGGGQEPLDRDEMQDLFKRLDWFVNPPMSPTAADVKVEVA